MQHRLSLAVGPHTGISDALLYAYGLIGASLYDMHRVCRMT
jgi:hypothetical protein